VSRYVLTRLLANFGRELQGGWRPARTVASHRQYSIRDKLLYNARLHGSGNGNALEPGPRGTIHGGFKEILRNPANDRWEADGLRGALERAPGSCGKAGYSEAIHSVEGFS